MAEESTFSVPYLAMKPKLAKKFMYRTMETAYKESCGKHFELPIFAPLLKKDGRYRQSVVELSQKLTASRVRRLILTDEIHSLAVQIAKYKELEVTCHTKTQNRTRRTIALEKEMDSLAEVDDAQPTSRFGAVLAQPGGWDIVVAFLKKEYRKSQMKKEKVVVEEKNYDEESNEPVIGLPKDVVLTKQEVETCWALLQEWRLFCTFEMAGRVGIKGLHHRKTDLEARYERIGSEDEDESEIIEDSRSGADRSGFGLSETDTSGKDNSLGKMGDFTPNISKSDKGAVAEYSEYSATDASGGLGSAIGSLMTSPMGGKAGTLFGMTSFGMSGNKAGAAWAGSPTSGLGLRSDMEASGGDGIISATPSMDATPSNVAQGATAVAASDMSREESTPSGSPPRRMSNARGRKQSVSFADNSRGDVSDSSASQKKKTFAASLLGPFTPSSKENTSTSGGSRKKRTPRTRVVRVLHQTMEGRGPFVEWQVACEHIGYYDSREKKASAAKVADEYNIDSNSKGVELLDGAVACARYLKEGESPLASYISNIAINEVVSHIEQINPHDNASNSFGSAVVRVLDDLAAGIEKIILGVIRFYTPWVPYLEGLRKHRIQSGRGTADDKEEYGEMQVDKQGQARIVPHADDIIDTDILHATSQRLQIVTVRPLIIQKIKDSQKERFYKIGELCCVHQYAMTLVAPEIQRVFRGTLNRMKKTDELRELAYASYIAAAVIIQSWASAHIVRKAYELQIAGLRSDIKDKAAIRLQAMVRFWNAHHRFVLYKHRKFIEIQRRGSTYFQSIIRGYLDRVRLKKVMKANALAKENALKEWAAIGIQKIGRGYVGRKRTIRSHHIRQTLSSHVLQLGERYLDKGNLWGLLKEVGDEFNRLNTVIQDAEDRENKWATTFINKVLDQRQKEFDGTWCSFADAVKSTAKTGAEGTGADRRSAIQSGKQNDQRLSAMGKIRDGSTGSATISPSRSSLKGEGKGGNQSAGGGGTAGPAGSTVQGPLLRRAISSTVRGEVDEEMFRQRKGSHNGHGFEGTASRQGTALLGTGTRNGTAMSSVLDSSASLSALPLDVTGDGSGIGCTSSPIKKATRHSLEVSGGDLHLTSTSMQISKADALLASYLKDIPQGLGDSIEKLVHAASIRVFVPDFFEGLDVNEAYQIYLQMPMGLAKMKYEKDAFKWGQIYINKLRLKGLLRIVDVLPVSKFVMFMKEVGCPYVLTYTCVDIISTLKKAKADEARNAEQAAVASSPPKQRTRGVKKLTAEETRARDALLAGGSDTDVGTDAEDADEGDDFEVLKVDQTLPSRLLHDSVKDGPWNKLTASIDEMFTSAAFLICPYAPSQSSVTNSSADTVTYEGHRAFKKHIAALQSPLLNEADRREVTKSRFRAALIMVTPFCLKLKSMGIHVVQDLVQIDLSTLDMPELLQKQVESLLSVVVSMTANAKDSFAIVNHEPSEKEVFAVPALYDTRFQRGPYDPYGRGPRLGSIKSMMKNKKKEAMKQKGVQEREYPLGLWNNDDIYADKSKDTNNCATVHVTAGDNSSTVAAEQPRTVLSTTTDIGSDVPKESSGKNSASNPLYMFHASTPEEKHHHGVDMDAIGGEEWEEYSNRMQKNRHRRVINSPPTELPPVNHPGTANSVNMSRAGKRKKSRRSTPYVPKPDFEAYVRGGFQREFVCSYPNCNQAFHRQYTLKVHEKSHENFEYYHQYKNNAQLFLDDDSDHLVRENTMRYINATSLPPVAQQHLDKLLRVSSSQQSARIDLATYQPHDHTHTVTSVVQGLLDGDSDDDVAARIPDVTVSPDKKKSVEFANAPIIRDP